MRMAIVLILCVLISACGGQQGGGSAENYYYNKITAWQEGELEYRDFEETETGQRMARDEVWDFLKSLNIRYVSERKDRWQDSLETESLGSGDCEDLANYYLLRLLELGRFADRDLVCMILDLEKTDHVVLTVRDRDGVWWVFDQSSSRSEHPYPYRLDRYLNSVPGEIIVAYNLFDIWTEDFPQFER